MFKNKKLLIVFIMILIVPFAFWLSGCDNGSNDEVYLSRIDLRYNGNVYSFNATDANYLSIEHEYDQNLSFASTDFELVLNYSNQEVETINSTEFGFTIKDTSTNQSVQSMPLTPGYYQIVFTYDDWFSTVNINITQKPLTKSDLVCSLAQSYPYSAELPEFTLTYAGNLLVEGTDYDISNINDQENVRYFNVDLKGCYSGNLVYSYTITQSVVEGLSFPNSVTIEYDGTNRISACNSKLQTEYPNNVSGVNSIQYIYKDTDGNILNVIEDVGTYKITAKVNVSFGYQEVQDVVFDLIITPHDISQDGYVFNIEKIFKDISYTAGDFEDEVSYVLGNNIEYNILMTSGNGIDNRNASSETTNGQFKIIGTNNYTGEIFVDYTIIPYTLNSLYVNVVYDDSTKNFDSFQAKIVTYDYESNFINMVENVDFTISDFEDSSIGGKIYTITGMGNYTGSFNGAYVYPVEQ